MQEDEHDEEGPSAGTSNGKVARVSPEPATSTTDPSGVVAPLAPTTAPIEWSVEDVIQYIASADQALAAHADLFRKHVSL